MVDRDGRALRRRPAALRDRDGLPAPQGADGRRRRHADDQPRPRAGARARRASRSSAPRSATATCWRCCSEKGWQLGGENSGHIICLDKHTTGDAIVAALRCCARWSSSGRRSPQAARRLTLFPQRLINVRVPKGFDWKAQRRRFARAQAGDGQRARRAGRVLLRPSGTEPVLRVMVEAREAALADRHAQALADAIAAATGA